MTQVNACSICHHPENIYGRSISTVSSLSKIQASANGGCGSCSTLVQGIKAILANDEQSRNLVTENDRCRLDINAITGGRSLEIVLFGPSISISVFAADEARQRRSPAPDPSSGSIEPNTTSQNSHASTLEGLQTALKVPSTTSSEASLSWARQQLENCQRYHPRCKLSVEQPSRPKTILDVGFSSNEPIRLCETKQALGPYACLSYCWGRDPFYRTTSSNYEQHLKEIPSDALPLTQREAVSFVRDVGLRYLWIDSLCIIQDDPHDWASQTSQMASIYQQATFVIVASKSSSVSSGIYVDNSTAFEGHLIKRDDRPEAGTVLFRRFIPHPWAYSEGKGHQGIPFPAFHRGWIMQERILASRVFHCGPQELSWECLEQQTCQCQIQPVIPWTLTEGDSREKSFASRTSLFFQQRSRTSGPDISHIARPKAYLNQHTWKALTSKELTRHWHHLVEDYSTLELSYPADTFPALSSLAILFSAIRKSQYLAGLWLQTLIVDLLWYTDIHPAQSAGDAPYKWAHRLHPLVAPSWSWGSVRCAVKYHDSAGGFQEACRVLHAECHPAEPLSDFGMLTGGTIQLEAHVVPVQVSLRILTEGSKRVPWNVLTLNIFKQGIAHVWIDFDCTPPGPHQVKDGQTVFILFLGTMTDTLCGHFLILNPCTNGQNGESVKYQRIGLLRLVRLPSIPEATTWQTLLGMGDNSLRSVVIC